MFRSFQIIIREFRRSLLKLLNIHDLVRFCVPSSYLPAYEEGTDRVFRNVVIYKNSSRRGITQKETYSIQNTAKVLKSRLRAFFDRRRSFESLKKNAFLDVS